MRETLVNWAIVGGATLVVGATASVAGTGSALVGSAAGSAIGAAIVTQRQDKTQQEKESQLRLLSAQVRQQNDRAKLEAELPILRAEVENLRQKQTELATVEGQLVQKQEELRQVEQRWKTVNQERQELESRVNAINQQNPQLDDREKLQARIEQSKIEISGLSGQIAGLKSEIERLTPEIERLTLERESLRNDSASLASSRSELERVTAEIVKFRNQLPEYEELQARIEQLRIETSGLSGQMAGLNSEIERLTPERESLRNVSASLASNSSELERVTAEIVSGKNQVEGLSRQAAELEVLRSTYDSLYSQQQRVEEQINQLQPEIARLAQEKQLILQAIQENQQEYQRIEELRQRLHSLNIEIRAKESELRERERERQQVESILTGLEATNARLRDEQQNLENEIRRLNGEIESIQSSSQVALRSLKEPIWRDLPNPRWIRIIDEKEFLEKFIRYIQSQGLSFPKRVIYSFHTALKVQDISALVVLAGISGTGKSELPQRYANYIGAQLLMLAVQPRWDSPQDLQGFYNYVEKKFKPTDLMRGLYQYNHDKEMKDRIAIVLLDEMNLARVEYYFSDFLSKLETRRNRATHLEIDVGSLPLNDNERRLPIPKEFLFVGTMNEDETTQSLSDKVLDRANVLTFGKPENLRLRQESQSQNGSQVGNAHPTSISVRPSGYLAYSDFQKWMKSPDPDSDLVQGIKKRLDRVNQVMERMGHPFAHRVYQAITQYVVNYPGVSDENSEEFRVAIADQFGQKLLPKLRGVMVDEAHENLDELEEIIINLGESALITAFNKARLGRYGQFHWQGMVYHEPIS